MGFPFTCEAARCLENSPACSGLLKNCLLFLCQYHHVSSNHLSKQKTVSILISFQTLRCLRHLQPKMVPCHLILQMVSFCQRRTPLWEFPWSSWSLSLFLLFWLMQVHRLMLMWPWWMASVCHTDLCSRKWFLPLKPKNQWQSCLVHSLAHDFKLC